MGVEYTHGLFVEDTKWRPTWRNVDQIDAVLRRWGFVRAEPAYYALVDENADEINEIEARSLPANLLVRYGTLKGKRARALMGASMYPKLADKNRYIGSTSLHLGSDYKVLQVEGEEVEVRSPAKTRSEPVDPVYFHSGLPSAMIVYPASWTSTRPRTDGPKSFDRVWRCAVLLECDKDVPAIAEDAGKLPARDFVRELAKAFGTKLVELGWFH